jgi:hypothetical protein
VPLTAPEGALDLSGLRSNYDAFMPLRASSVTHRFNVEGFLAHSTDMFEGATDAYTQVFRNGRVEIARAPTTCGTRRGMECPMLWSQRRS